MKLYDDLQIGQDATAAQIKAAYRRLAKLYHPDKTNGESAGLFHRIDAAYQVLSDPERRAAYDQFGDESLPSDAPVSAIEREIVSVAIDLASKLPEGTDIVGQIRKMLKTRRESAFDELEKLWINAEMMVKMEKVIRPKKNGISNLFVSGFRSKALAFRAAAEAKEEEIEGIDERMEWLADYESASPKPECNYNAALAMFTVSFG